MIVIKVAGGLGNQLQQYALYRKFLSLGRESRLDVSWFKAENQEKMLAKRELELDYFDGLNYRACTLQEKKSLTGGDSITGKFKRKLFPAAIHQFTESKAYHPELLGFDHMYISGYFACEKYYADILDELRRDIRFPRSDNPLNHSIAREMKECQSVSVHIRRGDYLNPDNRDVFGGICTDAYYDRAIDIMKRKVPQAHFYVFSDDILYAKKRYAEKEYTVVDINHGRDSFYDMWLMSNCQHNICANSTFSFWGARLNGNKQKMIVRPSIHKNGQVFVKKEMEDLWQGWRFVDSKGQIL